MAAGHFPPDRFRLLQKQVRQSSSTPRGKRICGPHRESCQSPCGQHWDSLSLKELWGRSETPRRKHSYSDGCRGKFFSKSSVLWRPFHDMPFNLLKTWISSKFTFVKSCCVIASPTLFATNDNPPTNFIRTTFSMVLPLGSLIKVLLLETLVLLAASAVSVDMSCDT